MIDLRKVDANRVAVEALLNGGRNLDGTRMRTLYGGEVVHALERLGYDDIGEGDAYEHDSYRMVTDEYWDQFCAEVRKHYHKHLSTPSRQLKRMLA